MNYGYLDFEEWGKELEIKAQEELLVRQNNDQERLNREEESERKTAEFRIKFGNYWYCRDVDTWVDLETRSIPHFDQVNRLCIMNLDCNQTEQSCITTLLYSINNTELTIDEYHTRNCRFDENIGWIFVKENYSVIDSNQYEESTEEELSSENNDESSEEEIICCKECVRPSEEELDRILDEVDIEPIIKKEENDSDDGHLD